MKSKRKIPTSLLVAITVSIVLLLTDVGLGIFFTIYSINSTTNLIKHKIMEDALTAASLLDGNVVGSLTKEDKDNKTANYTTAYNILNSFKTSSEDSNGELAYIYLLVKIDGKIVFSVDPSYDPGEFLVEEPINTEAMNKSFLGFAGTDDQAYVDRWGKLYSGYAPVKNDDGQVTAVVGVDVWADYLDKLVATNSSAVVSISAVTIALGVGLSLLITYSMRKKIKDLSNDINSLESDIQNLVGDIEKPLNDVAYQEEIVVKGDSDDQLTNIRNKLFNLRGEIRRYIDYAQEEASIDRLTRVSNRNAYTSTSKVINEQIKNNELKELVVAIYDVNGLKTVNDSTGHEIGDELLKIAANIIQTVYGNRICFRIGGDEFVIIYRGSVEEFKAKDEECKRMIDQFNNTNTEMPFILSLSVGYATYEVGQDNELLDIFRKADKNMYEVKKEFYKTHKNILQ